MAATLSGAPTETGLDFRKLIEQKEKSFTALSVEPCECKTKQCSGRNGSEPQSSDPGTRSHSAPILARARVPADSRLPEV